MSEASEISLVLLFLNKTLIFSLETELYALFEMVSAIRK